MLVWITQDMRLTNAEIKEGESKTAGDTDS